MSMRIRRIDKARDFMTLGPLWSKLARESGQISPFLSYDWFWCCWHCVWPQRRPEILVVEDAGSPVSIIPLMRWRGRLHGLPVRCLGFLECPITPMVDLLTVAEHGSVVETFLDHLVKRSDWDMAWLQKLPTVSPTLKTLEGILPGRLPWRRAGGFFFPCLTIAGQWTSFYAANSGYFEEADRIIWDRLERAGDVSLEEHRAVDPTGPLLQEALDVGHPTWETTQRVAVATMPRMPEFFRELTRRATKNGWLSLWLLRLNGHVVAMEYQLRFDGKVQALCSDEDPAYHELLPGMALNQAILHALFECGCVRQYIAAPGSTNDRFLWANGSHETVHLKLYRPAIYSRLLDRLEALAMRRAQK